MMGSFRVWLDAKQTRNNDAVPAVLRTPQARRLVRAADLAVAITAAAALALCILIGIGIAFAWPYLVASVGLLAGIGGGAVAVTRLARLEIAPSSA